MSVHEVAEIHISPDRSAAFEAAVAEAAPLFRAAPGCESFRLERSLDQPGRYFLVVGWLTVEAHTVDFRSSESFLQWRALVGTYFEKAPEVDHVSTAFVGF